MHRDRAEDVDRHPGDEHVLPRLALLDGASEQCARWAAVLEARVPRAGRVNGCAPPVFAERQVEGIVHAEHVNARERLRRHDGRGHCDV